MREGVVQALPKALAELLGMPVEVEGVRLLPGGASKEAWAVDAETPQGALRLLVRRAAGGVIYSETLSLKEEHQVLEAAWRAGVRVPRPYGYLPDLAGREAFVMERLEGESIGRRVVTRPELAEARRLLPLEMAEELAKIHAIPREALPFLPGAQRPPAAPEVIARLYRELDALEEPHPAIELGLLWLRENLPPAHGIVVNHGDFRLGNLMVGPKGLVGVLDWEFAHLGDPAEDLAWPLVRAWRFGQDHLRLGGIGEVEPYLEAYNARTGRNIGLGELFYWEVMGNVKWAIGALTQARRHLRGEERSVELAVLGRLASEMEYEILHLIEKGGY
ncbi:phosphotransferase family protein [Thermus scotoductus]|uniref:Phosphotransferase n=1 Tax=Thermus scotoductus TaxID=37636 RepID=A0A0N0ZRA9_THESC|nr:phosphotransferase family protein [Thermus scotoductus]KPD32360.1 phosphotransferase [Thermus scotoductus]RTG95632.1 phosphotransferase family protein [Thermus scotoductus]RTH00069.1 phosphotransferase family protein [Thermus scotoductus]RTH16449.1 phosphotransferase family protein [Thermus scotoductus]RTI21441.1 phosphotransferase family protein [Thermus scotoductus]